MSTTDNIEVVNRVVAAMNQRHDELVDELFTAIYVDHDPARAGAEPGPSAVRHAWSMLRDAFPDLRVAIHDTVAEGALVAVRGEVTGTHRGALMGVPATGRRVRMSLIDFNRIAGGRVAERWAQSDTLGLLQQLGVVPAPEDSSPPVVSRAEPSMVRPSHRHNGHAHARVNKTLCLRFSQVVLNDHRLERVGEFLAPDFVGHLAGAPGPVAGIDGWRKMFGGVVAAIPDYRDTMQDVISEGDLVASRSRFGGTHAGELFGSPPTGRAFAAEAMAFLRVRDGLIVELWTEADVLGVMGQIGLLEPIGGP